MLSQRYIFLSGVLATLAASFLMFLFRLGWSIPTLPEILLDRSTLFIPLSIYKVFILTLGPLAKPVLLISFIVAQLAGGGLVALMWVWGIVKLFPGITAELSQGKTGSALFKSGLASFIFCVFLWLFINLAFSLVAGLGFFGARLSPGPVIMSLAVAVLLVLYALSLFIFTYMTSDSRLSDSTLSIGIRRADQTLSPETDRPGLQRRRLIKRLSLGMLALFLTAGLGIMIRSILKAMLEEEGKLAEIPVSTVPEASHEITPTEVFYTVSKNFIDPRVDSSTWKLQVSGKVAKPLTFSLEELRNLPDVEDYRTLECISNEVGGDLIGNAKWKGVPLRYFLEKASVSQNAKKVVFHAADEYSDSISIDRAMNPSNLLAYEMNGAPLPDSHGYPARLLIPGIYGMKNVKWLTRIEVLDRDYYGYWQERGWSDRAEILIMSRMDGPENNRQYHMGDINSISGIAFAGDRGISRVEISQDGGKSWSPAEIKEPLSPYTWVLWVYNWEPLPGKYTLLVRASDKKGLLQESIEREPFPDGATGYHRITVRIA